MVIINPLCVAIFASACPPSFASPRRVEECGVERYAAKADPSCGVKSYRSARDKDCGVELYNTGFSTDCPGGSTQDIYEMGAVGNCRPGYTKKLLRTEGNSDFERPFVIRIYGCVRPEIKTACRLSEFGVERYNECRNPKFGIEEYNTCERPDFGVALYKECEIRKTRMELTTYIQNLDQNLDIMGVALLTNEANLLKSEGSEVGLACFIKRWNLDPLYTDLVTELKTQFLALFGVSYEPNNYDCSNQAQVNIPISSCDANDATAQCKALRAYKAARAYLETNKAEVAALIDDFVARSDSGFMQQLESLNLRILKFLQ
jgi:hypothetical protein